MQRTRRATKPGNEFLPDGIDGTITGGPMEPIGLLGFLDRGACGANRGGAVSGAAQVVADDLERSSRAQRGIALSDGSMICFASIADAGLLREDHVPVARAGQSPAAPNGSSSVPKGAGPRAKANRGACARVLAFV